MPDLSSNLWALPSPTQFIQRASQQMKDGMNLILFLPKLIDRRGFRKNLLDSLENNWRLNVQGIDLGSLEERSPFALLKGVFPGLKNYKMLEMCVQDSCLPDVIFLDNLETCSLKNRTEWFLAISRWSDASSRFAGKHSLVIITDHQAMEGIKLPDPDIKLVYQVWAGMPSALDIRMLCRLKTDRLDAESQWRENLLASLAGNDLCLAERLWEPILVGEEEVIQALQNYAWEMNWDSVSERNQLKNWRPKPPGIDIANKQNLENMKLLSRGVTVFTPEYGEEIHSAMLACLGRRNDISHRIWRAQANLLLPLIDEVRRRICEYMDQHDVEGRANGNQQKFTPPLEMGQLKVYIECLDRKAWEKQQWETGTKLSWSMRNSLAHYETISYRNFCEFWRFYNSVHTTLFQLSN